MKDWKEEDDDLMSIGGIGWWIRGMVWVVMLEVGIELGGLRNRI